MNAASASTSHLHLWSWIEASVTIGFPLVFLLFAFFVFRPEHVDHHPNRVYIGAALQGLIIGILVAFFVLPLRFAFFVPDPSFVPDAPKPPPRGIASLSAIPAFLLLLVVRRGFLARAPIVGRYIRAYRRAGLKHQIDGARRTLIRLEGMDARPTSEL